MSLRRGSKVWRAHRSALGFRALIIAAGLLACGGSGSDSGTSSLYSAFTPYIGLGTFPVDGASSLQTLLITDGGYGPTSPSAGQTSGTVTVTYRLGQATSVRLFNGRTGEMIREIPVVTE